MKRLLILSFLALFLSSICFAEEAAVTAPGNQAQGAEQKAQTAAKKPVKRKAKKAGSKVQKRRNKKKETLQ